MSVIFSAASLQPGNWSLFAGLSLKPPCCLYFGFNLGSLAVDSSASGLLNRTASVLEQIWSSSLFVWWLWVCIRLLIRVRLGCKSNVFVLNKKAVEYICMWWMKEETRHLSKRSARWSLTDSNTFHLSWFVTHQSGHQHFVSSAGASSNCLPNPVEQIKKTKKRVCMLFCWLALHFNPQQLSLWSLLTLRPCGGWRSITVRANMSAFCCTRLMKRK